MGLRDMIKRTREEGVGREVAANVVNNSVVQNLTEFALYGGAYINGVLADNAFYIDMVNRESPDWTNPGLIGQTGGVLILEVISDFANSKKSGSETSEKANIVLQGIIKTAQYAIAVSNAAVALWYTPLAGATMRTLADAIQPGLSADIDQALFPIYSTNPTVPATIAFANYFAAVKD